MQIQRRLPRRTRQMPAREMQLATTGNNDWRQQAAEVRPQVPREAIASTASQIEESPALPTEIQADEIQPTENMNRDSALFMAELMAEQSHTLSFAEEASDAVAPEPKLDSMPVPEPAPAIALANHESPSLAAPANDTVSGFSEPARFTQPQSAKAIMSPVRSTIDRIPAQSTDRTPKAKPIVTPAEPPRPIAVLGNSFKQPLSFDL